MLSTEVEDLIKRAEKLPLDEQLYLIARLADKARSAEAIRATKASKPLVGEELAALLESIDALPLESGPAPDGRTDISERHDDILYPKHGKMP